MWSSLRYRFQLVKLLWRQRSIMLALRMLVVVIGIAMRTWTWFGRTFLGVHLLCLVTG